MARPIALAASPHILRCEDLADVENWQFDAELQRRVSHIELPSKQIDADTAALIAAVLHKFSRLHTLNLSKNDIRDEGARVLAVHMRCMPELRQAIRHLDLSGNAITAAGACEIAREFLQRQGEDLNAADCAPILDLSDNPLEDLGVQVGTSHNVASYIQRSVRLRLRNVGLKKDGLLALLKQKQWIVELNVELNPIGDLTSVFRLCGAVQSEKCWRTLNVACLGGNATSGVGAESTNLGTQLASCLSNATGLKDLDCSGNGLGDTGAKEMVKAMKCTDGLERLALNDSGCYILTATMLQAALGANAGSQAVLRALELRGNALNDDCITVLAEGLSQSISLEKLMLAKNRITCNGAASLSRGLKKQRCLSNGGRPVVGVLELDLSENAIGDDGFQALVEAVCDCMGDQRSMQQSVRFEASWDLEKLHLWHTDIQRPTDFLIHAFSLRMRLLVEAVDVLEKNEPLQRRLMEQRRRRPECFEVFGLGRDEHLEMMKEGMFLTVGNLQELWARLMAGADQREALKAASEAADPRVLQAAIEAAEACSLPEKDLLQPRQVLAELKMREEAGAALVKAAAGKDMEVLESAIAKAKASLVPDSASAEAEIKLRELRQVAECEAATAALHAALEAADEKALQAAVVKAEACSLPEKELLQSRQVLAELKMREEAGAALVKAAAGNDMEEPEMPTPAESGVSTYAVSTCDMVKMDDSDEERSPYGGVVDAVDEWFTEEGPKREEGQGSTQRFRLDEKEAHRTSIRDLDSFDLFFNTPEPVAPASSARRVNRNLLLEMETETSSGSSSSQEWSTGSPALEPELPQKVVKWSSTGSGKGKECTHPKPKAPGKGGKVPLLPHQMLQRELQERIDRGEISPIPHKGEVSHLLHPAPAKGKGKRKGEKGEKVASEESKENEEGKEKEGKENEEGKEKEPKGKGKGPKGPPLPAAKAAAAPSDTAPPKGTGKGPGKGGKGPTKGPPMAKAKAGFGSPAAKAKVGVKRLEGVAPLGKKIHWGAHYEEPHDESVFKSLNDGVSFNSELLKAMLSTDSESKPMARRKSMTKKPTGISILDGPRAQNLAIVMSKMKVSTEEFCQNLKDLNFQNDVMSPDDVELLIHVLPTPEESKKLIEYKDRVQDLRDVEQVVMPFCVLHKGVIRMKVAKFALSHAATFDGVKNRCEVLQQASEQVRTSREFRELLSVVLRAGNYINHGVDEVKEGTIRAISVDSLSQLASFKTGAVSTMHFLALSMGSKDHDFLQALKASLTSVHEAAKEKSATLRSSIEAFGKDVDMAEQQLKMLLEPEGEAAPTGREELLKLMEEWSEEKVQLRKVGDEAFAACLETQKFFSISQKTEKLPPSEAFFQHIANFLDAFQEAWLEIEKFPKKWEEFATTAGFRLRVQRKSMPATSSSSGPAQSPRLSDSSGAGMRMRRQSTMSQTRRPRAPRETMRRSSAFAASFEDVRTPPKEVCRGVLNSVYTAVARKRLDCPRINLRRGSN